MSAGGQAGGGSPAGGRPRIGVVGVGHLGKHHARLLKGLDCELVAVADPSEAARAHATATWGVPAFADHRELIGVVDAVSVVVPTKLHREVASDFLRGGVDVLVEKPIARTAADGQALVDLAREHGRVLQVGHVERFNPALRGIAAIGESARYIESHRLAPFSFRSTDIGVVLDLMIHDLDLVLALVQSEIVSVDAFGGAVFTPDGTQLGWAAENQFNVGLQAGGEGKRILLVFADPDTLEKFKQGLLTGKVEGMAVAAEKGATGTSSFQNGVAVYVGQEKGLMAGGMVGMENFRYRALGKENDDPQ